MPRLAAFNFGARKFGFGSLFSSAAATEATYIEDVFSTYLYTGNGSTQTINNGIDLSTKGGLVWTKSRSAATTHRLWDTSGRTGVLSTDTTSAQNEVGAYPTHVYGLSNGFPVTSVIASTNTNGATYVAWTFRKQPKFFDVVTYTGTGGGPSSVAHSLGAVPGFVLIKSTSRTGNWVTIARNSNGTYAGFTDATGGLQSTDAAYLTSSNPVGAGALTATTFNPSWFNNSNTPGAVQNICDNGVTYVAYLFAHDAGGFGLSGSENVISCGSFTTDAGGLATVNLGYEPQWLLVKCTSNTDQWNMMDVMRGWNMSTQEATLYANLSNAESSANWGNPTATGFEASFGASRTYIYIAIRRGPMKTPTSGTSVFFPKAISSDASGILVNSGWPVDFYGTSTLTSTGGPWVLSRLTGNTQLLRTPLTNAEATFSSSFFALDRNDGLYQNNWQGAQTQVGWAFRRAPGFFDEVCYTGTGSATTVSHNLGVVPEFMIFKNRTNSAPNWQSYHSALGNTQIVQINTTNAASAASTVWNNTTPTSSVFTVGTNAGVNTSAENYVAYLFATCPGVSKVGSYTGNGSSQTINCGFTGGARFFLVKATSTTGSWWVYDSARGIIAANDPVLQLNSTSAEVTSVDAVDPDSTGIIVNQEATCSINANGDSYVYLAIA